MSPTLTKSSCIFLVACSIGLRLFLTRANASDLALGEAARTTRIWRNVDGLPSDSVTALIQTRDGFLWVGTSAGLVRFDGLKFAKVTLAARSEEHTSEL